MSSGSDFDVLGRFEGLVRDVPLPPGAPADDVARGRQRLRRRSATVALAAAAAVAVVVSSAALLTRNRGDAPAPAPRPTHTTPSVPSQVELGALTRPQQDRLFAATLDGFATSIADELDPSGGHLGTERLGEPVTMGSKGRFDRFVGPKYQRAPWSSIDLFGGRYRWQDVGGPGGELVVVVGAHSALPCAMLGGWSSDWNWECRAIDVPGAERALAGSCEVRCGDNSEDLGLMRLGRRGDDKQRVVSVERPDHLVVTIAVGLPASAAGSGPSITALGAAAMDARLTLPWTHPQFATWMPPPRIDDAGLRAAARQEFVGPGQEWKDSDYFYDDGVYLGQLHVSYSVVGPRGGGREMECIRRIHKSCETYAVDGKDVLVTQRRDDVADAGALALEYYGPRYAVSVSADAGVPGVTVAKAARFVTDDRWQPDWDSR